MKRKCTLFLVPVISVLLSLMCCMSTVVAAKKVETVTKQYPFYSQDKPFYEQALLEGIWRCYDLGYFQQSVDLKGFTSFNSITNSYGTNEKWNAIALPNTMNKLQDSSVSCSQLFNGYVGSSDNSFSGLFKDNSFPVSPVTNTGNTQQQIKEFLQQFGYTESDEAVTTGASSDYKCLSVRYTINKKSNTSWVYDKTGYVTLCANTTKEDDSVISFSTSNECLSVSRGFCIDVNPAGTEVVLTALKGGVLFDQYGTISTDSSNISWREAQEQFVALWGKTSSFIVDPDSPLASNYVPDKGWVDDNDGVNGGNGSYLVLTYSSRATMVKHLSSDKYKDYNSLAYNLDYKRRLYEDYLINFYGVEIRDENAFLDTEDDLVKIMRSQSTREIKYIKRIKDSSDANVNKYFVGTYYVPEVPKKNPGMSVYKIKDDGHFCAEGSETVEEGKGDYNARCLMTYTELVEEYNKIVEKVLQEQQEIDKEFCNKKAKEVLSERFKDIVAYGNMEATARSFVDYTSWLMASYKYGELLNEGLEGVAGIPVLPYSLQGYKDKFKMLYDLMMKGVNGDVVFSSTISDNKLLVTELYNTLVSMLDRTETDGVRITKWPNGDGLDSDKYDESESSSYGYVNELAGMLQDDIDKYAKFVDELTNKYEVLSNKIDKDNVGGEGTTWEKSEENSDIVECVTDEVLLADINNFIKENGFNPRSLNIDYTRPFDEDLEYTDRNDYDYSETACYNGAGPIGWLVCPLVKIISGIGEKMWGSIEESFMVVPVEVFDEGNGVKEVWDAIRDIGNVVFVLLFLVVIFSQLTGWGIDNYGIKKILPRLIMVAILANLSWIMCELMVDLSNIVGSGLTSLLTNAAGGIVPATETTTFNMVTGGVGGAALTGGAGYLFTLLSGGGLAGLAALGLVVLGAVIAIVSAILVMYIILIVRQAGVILLIVLAPVAIVCYALPNTEKLAKKWLDIFKALLVVYPLCGAAIGAGKLASAVLASIAGGDANFAAVMAAIDSGNLVELTSRILAVSSSASRGLMLAATIVQVLPFFFIPTLLKNSMSLMGNIGAKISSAGRGLGRKASGTLQSGVKKSRGFKDLESYSKSRRDVRRADRLIDKYKGIKPENLSDREKSLYNKALQTKQAYKNETDSAHGEAMFKNAEERRYAEQFARMEDRGLVEGKFLDALEGNDAEMAGAAFDELLARGGIEQVMDAFADEKTWDNMDVDVKKRLIQKMGSSKVDAFKTYNKYRGGGGTASFSSWYSGRLSREQIAADRSAGVKEKDSTYASHLMNKGLNALVGLDKDEIKFMRSHAPIAGELGGQTFNEQILSGMLAQTMVRSDDAETQTIATSLLCDGIRSHTVDVEDFNFTAGSLGALRAQDAESIIRAYTAKNQGDDEAAIMEIRERLKAQIAAIKQDPRVLSGMNETVKAMLGVDSSSLTIPHQVKVKQVPPPTPKV